VAALGAVIAAVTLVSIVLFGGGGGGYQVSAEFVNGGQLVRGNPVQSGGVSIGSVQSIEISDDGQAIVEMQIDDSKAPLPAGTRARIRQFSQSGIANRYVDLTFPPQTEETISDGGRIEIEQTTTQVDIDQLFNTLDPRTRRSLQEFFKNQAAQFRGRGEQANAGFRYLNPALSTSRRLFGELNRDTPVLERFLLDSSRLVTALAERRDDLAAMIGNLNETTRALGDEKQALADSISQLPPFMRRANTTFVNLRAALGDVDPLVEASKPVARRLGPFLGQARAFAADAEPAVRDLQRAIRRPGSSNDIVELLTSVPPLADIAVETRERALAPGGRTISVGETRGAFPEAVEAFRNATPIIADGRPYTSDLFGWFDDFSTTGPGFDALGANARAQINLSETLSLFENGSFTGPRSLGPVFQGDYRPCPGASEPPAPDGSNVFSEAEQAELKCTEEDRRVGP